MRIIYIYMQIYIYIYVEGDIRTHCSSVDEQEMSLDGTSKLEKLLQSNNATLEKSSEGHCEIWQVEGRPQKHKGPNFGV